MELSPYIEGLMILMGINIIAAVSYNLINGSTGQFSLGHAGFMAVGGFTAAILTRDHQWGLVPAFLVGGISAGFIGLLVGWPTLRLKGDYLAIATLGVGEIIRVVITNLKITGAAQGLAGLPSLRKLTGVTAIQEQHGGTLPVWAQLLPLVTLSLFVIVTVVVIWNLLHSARGRAIVSVREDEIAAEAMGVNTTYHKVLAFVIGSFFAGLAGAWQVHNTGVAAAEEFNLFRTVELLIFIVFGGLGSTSGAIIAAAGLTWLSEQLKDWTNSEMVKSAAVWVAAQWELVRLGAYRTLGVWNVNNLPAGSNGLPVDPYLLIPGPLWKAIFSLLLIVIMLVRPKGLLGTWELPYLFWRPYPAPPDAGGWQNLEEPALHSTQDPPITVDLHPSNEESTDAQRRHETGEHR
ncbi:MAG: hypothetical protein GEEBNDBF_01873 [bacterium]|nr:hypothetical protein [bacterium]